MSGVVGVCVGSGPHLRDMLIRVALPYKSQLCDSLPQSLKRFPLGSSHEVTASITVNSHGEIHKPFFKYLK